MRIAVLLAALALAGCGHGAPRPFAAHRAPAPATSRPAAPRLVTVWRNFELTGIPEELTIFRDGALRYRNLLHTQHGIPLERGRLRPAELVRIERLLSRTDLGREDSSGVRPRRSGFRWVIRAGGRTGTAADGHLRGPVRPLVAALGRVMDRLREAR
jgi:hypothetical protein